MQLYKVRYKGNIYTNLNISKNIKLKNNNILTINNTKSVIMIENEVIENNDKILLKLYHVIFDIIDDFPVFDKKLIKEIEFNYKENQGSGDLFIEEFLFKKEIPFSDNYFSNLLYFLDKIISINENISKSINETPDYIPKTNIGMCNLLNLIVFNLSEFEKFINSDNTKFLKDNLDDSEFIINVDNKLNNIIGVPKFVIPIIKELELEGVVNEIKELSKVLDGNSLRIFFDFIKNMKIIFNNNYEKKYRQHFYKEFFNNIAYICKFNYKITDLLNYLLRQNMYFSSRGIFSFPNREAMYLKDYLRMSVENGLKYEKYPSQLKRQHDLLSKNIYSLQSINKETELEFINSINKYKFVEMEIEIDSINYLFLTPNSILELIQEGTNLHHCVSSYANRIMLGESRIVFLRKEKNESYITIDIDNKCNLIEAKKAFNEELDSNEMKIIEKWLKKVKEI